MKFGKLLRATVDARMPHWREHTLQYKYLKQVVKKAAEAHATQGASAADIAQSFTMVLDQEVEKVNDFYMDRIEEGVIILHALQQHAEQLMSSPGSAPTEQRTACQRSLVSFHFNLLMLQNYVALNFTGIVKILKKFDKKLGQNLRTDYINAIVELPFYRCQALGQLVEDTEKQFTVLDSSSVAKAGGPASLLPAQPMQMQMQPSPCHQPTWEAAAPMCSD